MWKERDGEYYLYDSNDNLIADFAMSTVYEIPRAMWVNRITGEEKEFEVPDGNVNAAMREIEYCLFNYCNDKVKYYDGLKDDIIYLWKKIE